MKERVIPWQRFEFPCYYLEGFIRLEQGTVLPLARAHWRTLDVALADVGCCTTPQLRRYVRPTLCLVLRLNSVSLALSVSVLFLFRFVQRTGTSSLFSMLGQHPAVGSIEPDPQQKTTKGFMAQDPRRCAR